MATPNLAEIPSDLLADFRLESSEQFQRCEQLLIELEHTPGDSERLRELFRLVHTLKGNLGYIGLDALMKVPQAMEDVLARLREAHLDFDSLLGDILLLTLDHLKEQIRHALGGAEPQLSPAQSKALTQALSALALALVATPALAQSTPPDWSGPYIGIFGGYNQSGFGGRDNSIHAHDQYTQLKTIWLDLTDTSDSAIA